MIREYNLEILCNKYNLSKDKIITKNNNILIYGEYVDIDNTLNYLINNPETVKKMGQESYRIFSDEYSLSQCLTKINNSYLELLD